MAFAPQLSEWRHPPQTEQNVFVNNARGCDRTADFRYPTLNRQLASTTTGVSRMTSCSPRSIPSFRFIRCFTMLVSAAAIVAGSAAASQAQDKPTIRIGIIGLDTSHVGAFTKVLNDPKAADDVSGCKVVAAYPKGSPDIESSTSRVPKYTADMKARGVKIVDSIDDLIAQVDAVLLETNDGRPHLAQVLPVLKAGKPVFIDKPIAGSLEDAIAIFAASKHYKTPVFSSSSLRYAANVAEVRSGAIGDVLGAHTYSPAHLEKTHPDLFWYGIHGVELLFSVMGEGCRSVTRTSTNDFDVVTGTWDQGRIGVFRGIRKGASGYGGTAFGSKKVTAVGPYGGYRPLVVEIVQFFRTRKPPVSASETLQIYAFMEAADESKRRGGIPVSIDAVLESAELRANAKLKELLK